MRALTRLAMSVLALVVASCGPSHHRCTHCEDTGVDSGFTLSMDAGPDATDAGQDSGTDAGVLCANLPGLYAPGSCTQLAPGVQTFEPRFPLWSDGAEKERFVLLPPNPANLPHVMTIDATNPDAWVYPVGTTFWKHFSRSPNGGGVPIRVETRMLKKVSNAGVGAANWEMRTFVWNAAHTEVTEVVSGQANALGTPHDIPIAPGQCQNCHRTPDAVLGFTAMQLNNPGATSGSLTLAYMLANSAEYFGATAPVTMTTTTAIPPGNSTEREALGYLHGNCGHCHNAFPASGVCNGFVMFVPVGVATVAATPTYMTGVGVARAVWNPGTMPTLYRIQHGNGAGNAPMSSVYLRMGSRVLSDQMPPLATEIVDPTGIATVTAWINSLP